MFSHSSLNNTEISTTVISCSFVNTQRVVNVISHTHKSPRSNSMKYSGKSSRERAEIGSSYMRLTVPKGRWHWSLLGFSYTRAFSLCDLATKSLTILCQVSFLIVLNKCWSPSFLKEQWLSTKTTQLFPHNFYFSCPKIYIF